jgi:geranylgeranyl pyrophosphate synthase
VAETLARLSPEDAEGFRSRLGQAHLAASEVAELRTLMVDCGAREAVEAQIEREIATARGQIDRLALAASDRDELHEFATWLVSRSA